MPADRAPYQIYPFLSIPKDMSVPITEISKTIRHHILTMTTAAGSGHPTSSLSATDLMSTLMFGGFFRFDIKNPAHPNNDRLIFSKGHASPLFYALWAVAGGFPKTELNTLRQFGSRLEGHPTLKFPFTEAATGSLGQGLSIGVGMAINAKYLDKLPYKTYVLLGDSEMAEGSNWEAMMSAAHYKLNNLVTIIDVNRLGQRGETMFGKDANNYKQKAESFGWKAVVIDGHKVSEIQRAFKLAQKSKQPFMIVAKTLKGKGVKFLENKEGWHGKALDATQLQEALTGLGKVNEKLVMSVKKPLNKKPAKLKIRPLAEIDKRADYDRKLATREAYGHALVEMFPHFPNMVVLDAEVSNSSFAETFKKKYPKHFFEMFIAEQNMVGVALGLSRRGKIPFVSTFAAFFTRAADQIRMARHSGANIKFVGSHCGVSIGEDGGSQMGLEDLALFRAVPDSVVLYPADHVAEEKLSIAAAEHPGIVYLRTTRGAVEPIYEPDQKFTIGGSTVLRSSWRDKVTIVAAGITLVEALKAYELLKKQGITARIIDLYSIKPLDVATLKKAAKETNALIVVEDHYPAGGIGEAVATALSGSKTPVISLAVKKLPMSGKPAELLTYEEINADAIVTAVKSL